MQKIKGGINLKKLEEQINNLKGKNKFLNFILNGKNSAIIILSFLLFMTVVTYPTDNTSQIANLNNQIQNLNQQIDEKNKVIENNPELQKLQEQVVNLQNANQSLSDNNKKLEEEKTTLENEKNELNKKLDEAQKTSSATSSSANANSSSSQNSNNTNKSVKSQVSESSTDSQGYTVYITKTGKKYHRSNCSSLSKSKISIDINDAKSQGYTACSKCNP